MRFWRTPLDSEKFATPHGEIHIIVERCKGCEFCVEYCPRGVLQLSKSFNKKGYHYPEAIKEGACVDCDLCESICPEFAIISVRIDQESADDKEKGDAQTTPDATEDNPDPSAEEEKEVRGE